jgi:hypothetical protein
MTHIYHDPCLSLTRSRTLSAAFLHPSSASPLSRSRAGSPSPEGRGGAVGQGAAEALQPAPTAHRPQPRHQRRAQRQQPVPPAARTRRTGSAPAHQQRPNVRMVRGGEERGGAGRGGGGGGRTGGGPRRRHRCGASRRPPAATPGTGSAPRTGPTCPAPPRSRIWWLWGRRWARVGLGTGCNGVAVARSEAVRGRDSANARADRMQTTARCRNNREAGDGEGVRLF